MHLASVDVTQTGWCLTIVADDDDYGNSNETNGMTQIIKRNTMQEYCAKVATISLFVCACVSIFCSFNFTQLTLKDAVIWAWFGG